MSNSTVKDEFYDEMLADFLDESGELLEQLNDNLLQLDEWVHQLEEGDSARCDDDLMNEMFRAAHSFKGLSAMLGLNEINQLTHKVENVFDAARNDKLPMTPEVVELIFQSVDRLVGMVECLKDPNAEEVDCQSVLDGIQGALQNAGAEAKHVSREEAEATFSAALQDSPEVPEEATAEEAAEEKTIAEEVAAEEVAVEEVTEEAEVATVEVTTIEATTTEVTADETTDLFADITDDEEISPKYLTIFIDEAESSLDDLSEQLLSCDEEDFSESLLITCHRIKGSAASVGLNRAAKLAHYMEDLLQELRQTEAQFTPEMADAMLRCTDALRAHVDELKQGNFGAAGFNTACTELLATRGSTAAETPDAEQSANEPAAKDSAAASSTTVSLAEMSAAAPAGLNALAVTCRFRDGLPLAGLKARLVYEKATQQGQVFWCQPSEEELDEIEELSTLLMGLASDLPTETLPERLTVEGVEQIEITPLSSNNDETTDAKPTAQQNDAADGGENQEAAEAKPTSAATKTTNQATPPKNKSKPAEAPTNAKPAETVRVDIDRLDQLMNLAGQLVINKARFAQIGDSLKHVTASKQSSYSMANVFGTIDRLNSTLDASANKEHVQIDEEAVASHVRRMQADLQAVQRDVDQFKQMRSSVNELLEAIHQLDRVSDGIQKSVMDTRMVPIGPLFGRFKRVIRDITRDNGKEIDLAIRGEKTELDKRMIDELGDPLIHMIRNSADHGVELPEERLAAGKSQRGTVTLDAFHRGNSIVIQVSDDGKGLDPEKIRNKALEKGIITPADAERLTQHQMFQLIWEPGLSTAEKVTQVSGRGMGMDIVRSKIEELNGAIELNSKVGEGTTITIKLPLTLAILPSLLADIDGDVFAVPVESVVEIVRVPRKDLATVHGLLTACVRGRTISVVTLANLFTWRQPALRPADDDAEDVTLVVAGVEGKEIGLVVHDLLGEEDVVIKSMAENYRNVEGVAGASILGDGRVSLILDVGALLEAASTHSHGTTVS